MFFIALQLLVPSLPQVIGQELPVSSAFLRHDRQLQQGTNSRQAFMSVCQSWDSWVTGCQRGSQNFCVDYLNQGPSNSDIEITLGNLTASTPGNEVRLQWWAPRASPTRWNPLDSLTGCAVYYSFTFAWPNFGSSDFNGGSVRVKEDGTATLRVRSPATYFVSRYVATPSVRFRLCSNGSASADTTQAVLFTPDGMSLYGLGAEGESTVQILNATNLTWTTKPGEGNRTDQTIAGVLVVRNDDDTATTTSTTHAGPLMSVTNLVSTTLANGPTTGTTPATAASTSQAGQDEALIVQAKEQMTAQALEFSPVYQCFAQNKFYDQFTADCTDKCSDNNVVVGGQCVSPTIQNTNTTLRGVWMMNIGCDEACWAERGTVALHYSRLALAYGLKIPFEEVTTVGMSFPASSDRRMALSPGHSRLANFQIMVSSERVDVSTGIGIMQMFMKDPAQSSRVFGFPVLQVAMTSLSPDNNWQDMSAGSTVLSRGTDIFQSTYERSAPKLVSDAAESIVQAGWPIVLIVCISAGVLAVAAIVGFVVLRRRQKLRSDACVDIGGSVANPAFDDETTGTVIGYPVPNSAAMAGPDASEMEDDGPQKAAVGVVCKAPPMTKKV